MTTLEEVFLKIGDEVDAEDQTNGTTKYVTNEPNLNRYEELITEDQDFNPHFWQTFKAFIYIRFLIFIRNPMHTFPIIVLPIIIIIVSYFLMKSSTLIHMRPIPLLLNPNIYAKNATLLYSNTSIDTFVSLVEKFGVRAEPINNFDMKSMNNSFICVDIKSLYHSNKTTDWHFLFNISYYHSLPIVQNLMTNVFNYFQNPSLNQSLIKTYNHPFPQTDRDNVLLSFDSKVYTYVILMAIMLGSIPPAIAVEVVEDREVIFHFYDFIKIVKMFVSFSRE